MPSVLPRLCNDRVFEARCLTLSMCSATRFSILTEDAYLELIRVSNTTEPLQVLHGANPMGGFIECQSMVEDKRYPTLLTTEDLGDIEPRVLLGKELPCTNDTIGRIDQGAVHVKEASMSECMVRPLQV